MNNIEYTSDRVAVVHARWIQYGPDLHGTEPLECSACNYIFGRIYPRNYCPNCGAKMDGERRDDEGCPSFVRAIPITWIDKKITGYASQLRSHELDSLVTVKNMWERDLEE